MTTEDVQSRNEITSTEEMRQFMEDKPDKVFAYVDSSEKSVTNWMGSLMGKITYKGPKRLVGFGATGHSIEVKGTNGKTYHGVYYSSSGTYCRLKAIKG